MYVDPTGHEVESYGEFFGWDYGNYNDYIEIGNLIEDIQIETSKNSEYWRNLEESVNNNNENDTTDDFTGNPTGEAPDYNTTNRTSTTTTTTTSINNDLAVLPELIPTPAPVRNSDEWNDILKTTIKEEAEKKMYPGSCGKVMRAVLEDFGFSIDGLEGPIGDIISYLEALAAGDSRVTVLNSHEEAQKAANESTGDYIVLAMATNWETKYTVKGVHHVAIVIGGKYDPVRGPAIGGGGLSKSHIKQILSDAKFHFSWGWTGKKGTLKNTKNTMFYVKFGIKE